MTRNWAAFTSVALVAVLLAAIGIVGATQGLFGFGRGDEDALDIVELARMPGDGLTAADAAGPGSSVAEAAVSAPRGDASSRSAAGDALRTSGGAQADGTSAAAADDSPRSAGLEGEEGYDDDHEGEYDDEGEREDDDPEHRSEALVAATPGVQTFQIGEAGFVTLDLQGEQLSVVEVAPAAGWTVREVEEEDGGREVQVELRAGEREVTFAAHYEDGLIRARVGVEYEDD